MKKIGIILGSIRANSTSKKIADFIIANSPECCAYEIIDTSNLPLYHQDRDTQNVKEYADFKEKIKSLNAVLFITPEHNRSVPTALKNALDIGSRPYGENVWSGLPGAVISQSSGNLSGFGSNHHVRQVLTFLNIYTMQQPEAYIANARSSFDEQGNLTDASTIDFIKGFLSSFKEWIEKFA